MSLTPHLPPISRSRIAQRHLSSSYLEFHYQCQSDQICSNENPPELRILPCPQEGFTPTPPATHLTTSPSVLCEATILGIPWGSPPWILCSFYFDLRHMLCFLSCLKYADGTMGRMVDLFLIRNLLRRRKKKKVQVPNGLTFDKILSIFFCVMFLLNLFDKVNAILL